MSNGIPPITGTNLTHPTSGNTEILRDVKGAIRSVAVLGLKEAFSHSEYEKFRNIKITSEYPIKNQDFPCIVVGLKNLTIKQSQLSRASRDLVISFPEGKRILREERRSFSANLIIYHAAYNTAELGLLSDAILDIFSYDPGNYFCKYRNANVPGIAYSTGEFSFSGESMEPSYEKERYVFSDAVSIPIYGEVVMNAWYRVVGDYKIATAIVGAGTTIIQDYPEGWDW